MSDNEAPHGPSTGSEVPDLSPAALEAAGALGGAPDPGYTWPSDPLVAENLESWRDLKLGVIIHWGPYAAIGQGGSWSLHRERLGWFTDPPEGWAGTDAEYHSWYYEQARTLSGDELDLEDWARVCADAGMRYCVFTTKHHDGYCTYDSAYTNLKVTAEDSAVGRDVLREAVDAFRGAGLEMGAYFSKADWSRPEYWDRARPITDRYHNYDIAARPRAWQRFVSFTHDQVAELLEGYGPWKVLWLDAGWVREPDEPIDVPGLAAEARRMQPGILVVDREVHGPYEDYRTPEQEVPEQALDYPWESCITLTREWCSMSRDDPAKPTREIIANLIRIVARGGNYLIGIGPDATGHMPDSVRRGLAELGEWMAVCGEGIYGTRVPAAPPVLSSKGVYEWHLTEPRTDVGRVLYAFGLAVEDDLPDAVLRVGAPVERAWILDGPDGRRRELEVGAEGADSTIAFANAVTHHAVALRLELA